MSTNSEAPIEQQLGPQYEKAVFGREVEQFIEEDRIGRYLVEKARKQAQEAMEKLVEVDPTNTGAIMKLQFQATVANRVAGWLGEAVSEGRQALDVIQQERDEHGL